YSDYYTVIDKPISMSNISEKVKRKVYDSVAQYAEDWYLMFRNARRYNIEGSEIYNDAGMLYLAFRTALKAAVDEHGFDFVDEPEELDDIL
ncbi:Bromodomain-containing protein, partial [Dendrothele bispora CBS 962.96]